MDTLISILGGAIWNNHDLWQTNGLNDPGDHNGVTNDHFRVLAGASLYKRNPKHTTLFVQGGLAKDLRPSIASVIKEELKAFDVPEDHIVLEERSVSTFSQLFELKLFTIKQKPMRLLIISNEWHLPRIEAMIKWIPELHELAELNPQSCAAEEILLQDSEKDWRIIIETARRREDIVARIVKEQQGVAQLQAGTYRYH